MRPPIHHELRDDRQWLLSRPLLQAVGSNEGSHPRQVTILPPLLLLLPPLLLPPLLLLLLPALPLPPLLLPPLLMLLLPTLPLPLLLPALRLPLPLLLLLLPTLLIPLPLLPLPLLLMDRHLRRHYGASGRPCRLRPRGNLAHSAPRARSAPEPVFPGLALSPRVLPGSL